MDFHRRAILRSTCGATGTAGISIRTLARLYLSPRRNGASPMKSSVVFVSAILAAMCSCLLEAQPSQQQHSTVASAHPYVIQFPRDLYDHPSYQTEWWYFTGNLEVQVGEEVWVRANIFSQLRADRRARGPASVHSHYFCRPGGQRSS